MITAFMLCLCFVLMARVWDIMILRGEDFQQLSERNRLREVRVIAPRGNIYDRTGSLLAYDSPSFNLYITRENVQDLDKELGLIFELTDYPAEKVNELKNRISQINIYLEYPLIKDLSFEQVSRIETRYEELPGFSIKIAPIRKYDYADVFVHVLGYMREIDRANLEVLREYGYRMGDYFGVSGLESVLNQVIKGIDGRRVIEVDALGREIFELSSLSPKRGSNIYTTLDKDFQLFCHQLLKDHKAGSIIVMDVNTGDLLVLVSKPGFDPNIFFPELSIDQWQKLLKDPVRPLQDRSVAGLYSPGSVFKMVMALAGLQEGIIDEFSSEYCRGRLRHGNRFYHCWQRHGHGNVSLRRAIAESCNIYFYILGEKLGIERIHYYAELFGLGQKTGIILPNERAGLVPNDDWKRRTRGEPWYPGETLSVSIGQGSLLVTPIQLAVLTAFFATEGRAVKPRLVKEIEDYRGLAIENLLDEINISGPCEVIDSDYYNIVKDGLEMTFSYERGTARRAFIRGHRISGKTGTSQVAGLERTKEGDEIPYHLRNHNIIVSFSEKEGPEIAVVVFIAHGGEQGSSDRIDITRSIYDYYYSRYRQNR